MQNFTRRFGFHRRRGGWDRSSVGVKRGSVGKGKYSCWEAVGPVREVWTRIGPEIKECVETLCKDGGPPLAFEIYMIGRTEDKAEPKILICSEDVTARKAARRAIEDSGIMRGYPPIGLGDASRVPDLLAQESVAPILPFDMVQEDEPPVLSTYEDIAFGRRLFISSKNSNSLRPATGGPILYVKDKIYQITAGHSFFEPSGMIPSGISSSSLDDCDFDGMSDSEDEDVEMEHQGSPAARNTSTQSRGSSPDIITDVTPYNLPSFDLDTSLITSQHSRDSGVDLPIETCSVNDDEQPHIKAPIIPPNLSRAGKLALHSEMGNKQSLDYALVELEGNYLNSSNEVPWGANITQRFLQVRPPPERMGPSDVTIFTRTASSKFLSGKLSATASYMRLPNQTIFQELYPVHLDGSLHDGDCGSGILDLTLGHFYGHIIAGYIGTGLCYIVSAKQVFEDIKKRLEVENISLEPANSSSARKKWKGRESLRIVEIGSKQYLSELKRSIEPSTDEEDLSEAIAVNPASKSLFISAIDHQVVEKVRQRIFEDPAKDSRRQPLALNSRVQASNLTNKWKASALGDSKEGKRKITEQQTGLGAENNDAFKQRFFALPSVLQVQIIAFLSITDILHLRLVSTNWNSLISQNEAPIARAFLENSPVPRFALTLYPLLQPSSINLCYIRGVWYRMLVASQLSSEIAQWITRDHFLLKDERERLEFLPQQARMRRRLIPLIFTISHFLENYCHLRLKNPVKDRRVILESCSYNPVEAQVMSMYDDKTLLQVHQVFPLLLEYFRRMFRPPSYLNRLEKPVRGYGAKPPTDDILSAILYIGGLNRMVKFSKINTYEARITTVNEWYSSISGSEPNPGRRWPRKLSRKQSKVVSSNSATYSADHLSPIPIGAPQLSNADDRDTNSAMPNYIGNPSFQTSLAAGLARSTLLTEQTPPPLLNLPSLQHLWIHTADTLLLKRGVIQRIQDIKKNAQLLDELVREAVTDADELSCERAMLDINQGDLVLVQGTFEELVYMGGESLSIKEW